MVKINSPSGLLTSANSLFGKLRAAPSNPLLKKCYYNGVDLIANKSVQSLVLLNTLLRRNSFCLWIYSHRQDISTLRPVGYWSTANEQTALPQLVVCEIFLDIKSLLLLDNHTGSWDEKQPSKNCSLVAYCFVDFPSYICRQNLSLPFPQS